eukprot:gene52685-12195_t
MGKGRGLGHVTVHVTKGDKKGGKLGKKASGKLDGCLAKCDNNDLFGGDTKITKGKGVGEAMPDIDDPGNGIGGAAPLLDEDAGDEPASGPLVSGSLLGAASRPAGPSPLTAAHRRWRDPPPELLAQLRPLAAASAELRAGGDIAGAEAAEAS